MHNRLIYSLLKPAIRAAARFRVPIRSLCELVRLAYFEQLAREELSTAEIAERFGQTSRNVQSLARRLKGEFFVPEREAGLVRDVEAFVAAALPTDDEVVARFTTWGRPEVIAAIELLLRERRIERRDGERLATAQDYVVMTGEQFHHRIDSLNHFLDGAYRAIVHRLVLDNRRTAMMKTISFSAIEGDLEGLLQRVEGALRRELGQLDENATFQGRAEERYTICIGSAPCAETVDLPQEITAHDEDSDLFTRAAAAGGLRRR